MIYYFRDKNGFEYPYKKTEDGSFVRIFVLEIYEY